jgi:hypothetical protein
VQSSFQALMLQRLTITLAMPPPVMVVEVVGIGSFRDEFECSGGAATLKLIPRLTNTVEVVSPEKKQCDRDYIHKLAQYEAIAIPTYWIVDPQQQKITVFQLVRSGYQNLGEFRNEDIVICPSFPALALTANQILNAG